MIWNNGAFATEILEAAPKGATHYLIFDFDSTPVYIKLSGGATYIRVCDDWKHAGDLVFQGVTYISSLEDLKALAKLS